VAGENPWLCSRRLGNLATVLHADPKAVEQMLVDGWELPGPVQLTSLPSGATADVWTVTDAAGRRYVAKLIYDAQPIAEQGLAVAEAVRLCTSIPPGAPVRTRTGALTAMAPSVHGLEHPLALLDFVDGEALWPGAGLAPEPAADLLARLHAVAVNIQAEVTGFDQLLAYIDDAEDIAYARLIRRALHETVERMRGLLRTHTLTTGICYGDGPEVRRCSDGSLALVDWGGVTRAPLLWDVACWAGGFSEGGRARFLARYADSGTPAAADLSHLAAFDRVRIAWLLRFRAYRAARADHYDETAADDAVKVRDYAARLGVDMTST
jgi:hypothetical protein